MVFPMPARPDDHVDYLTPRAVEVNKPLASHPFDNLDTSSAAIKIVSAGTSIAKADAKTRKGIPVFSGLIKYFPDALMAVAEVSRIGNEQHNPGQPLHWSREKSSDHADCLVRHQFDAGHMDTDGVLHDAKVAWRALAQLQLAIEARRQ